MSRLGDVLDVLVSHHRVESDKHLVFVRFARVVDVGRGKLIFALVRVLF